MLRSHNSSISMKSHKGYVLFASVFLNVFLRILGMPQTHNLSVYQPHLKNKKHFVQDDDYFVSPGQVFGSCYEMQLYRKTIKVKCMFSLETKKAIHSQDHLRVCNFSLKSFTDHDHKNYYTPLKLTAISENIAILVIENIDYKRLYILHFTDCRAVEVQMGFRPNNLVVAAPFDDIFDIIFTEDEKGFCDSKYCRMVIDTEGKIIENKQTWLREDSDIVAVVHATLKGRLVVDRSRKSWTEVNESVIRVYVVNEDASITIIRQYKARPWYGIHYDVVTTSTTNDIVTVCFTKKNSLTYAQFDCNGNIKFEGTLTSEKIDLVHTLKAHNLPEGGFLLVITVCTREKHIKMCKKHGDNIMVKKFDNNGKDLGTLNITSWKHINIEKLHFYVNNEKRMCLSDVNGHDSEYDGTILLNITCFEDTDFPSVYL